jgi:hypothetical protein
MLPEYYPETRAQFPPTPETPIPRHIGKRFEVASLITHANTPNADHCIDMYDEIPCIKPWSECLANLPATRLRQSELCHADMTLLIFEWHEDDPHPVNIHHAPHICANPDKLERFLEEHTVPPIGPILKHPWTGTSTPAIYLVFRKKLTTSAGETPWPFE